MIIDKKFDKKIIDNLLYLGLSEKQAMVYFFLVGRQTEVGTSKIILATGLHGQYVYDALDFLELNGLVKHVVKNNRKKWSANPPHRLETLIDSKRMIANQVRDSLEKIYRKNTDQEFEIYQGEEQFTANEFEMLEQAPENSEICVIAGKGDKFSETLADRRRSYNAKGIEKNIMIRYIGTTDQKDYLAWVKERRENFFYRILPGLHTSTVSTSIHYGALLFQVYGDPLLVFKVTSKQIADDYRSFFETLWNMCPEQK